MSWKLPPEWHPQDWLWIGFPHDEDEWPGFLEAAQAQIAAFASAVAESGQEVRLLVRDEANEAHARSLASSKVRLERRAYGDIWLRDTGPLVVLERVGEDTFELDIAMSPRPRVRFELEGGVAKAMLVNLPGGEERFERSR